MKVYIYTLEHPITKEVRYVGKTKNPKERFHNHCNRLHNEHSHKRNWINSLKKEGLRPVMKILDEVLDSDWKYWEKYWILQLRCWGFNLVNHTSGGDGLSMGNSTSFKKGQIPWNTGLSIFENKICIVCNNSFKPNNNQQKTCSIICANLIRTGHENTQFKKGFIPWNKGKRGVKLKPDKNVYQYSPFTGEFIKEWDTAKKAGESLNINITGIGQCCNNRAKSAGGFIWRYYKQQKIEIINNVKLKINI